MSPLSSQDKVTELRDSDWSSCVYFPGGKNGDSSQISRENFAVRRIRNAEDQDGHRECETDCHMSESERHISESERRMSESERHMSESERRMSESERRMSESERQMPESERHMSESERHMSESERHMSESDCHMSESERHIYGHQQGSQTADSDPEDACMHRATDTDISLLHAVRISCFFRSDTLHTFRVYCPLGERLHLPLHQCTPGAWVYAEVFRNGVPITQESAIRQARAGLHVPQRTGVGNHIHTRDGVIRPPGPVTPRIFAEAATQVTSSVATEKTTFTLPESESFRNHEIRGTVHDSVEICTMVRDEESKIVEWVEYHVMIGANLVHVYLHMSRDGIAQALEPYVRDGQWHVHIIYI